MSDLSPVFDEMYSAKGRPSVPPEFLDMNMVEDGFDHSPLQLESGEIAQ